MNSFFFFIKVTIKWTIILIESRFLLIEFYKPAIVCKTTLMIVTTAVKGCIFTLSIVNQCAKNANKS